MAKSSNHNVKLSKSLSYILRHGAEQKGLTIHKGGYVYVDELLKLSQFRHYGVEDVKQVVRENDKQRFSLEEDSQSKRLLIRANQGHTMKVDLELTPILSAAEYPTVVHGTFKRNWQTIQTQGLHHMARNHIHFAPGEPGESGVISGMRQSCDILIFLNLEKALADGIQFYISANSVILSSGDKDGYILPKYFDHVLDRKSRRRLHLETDSQET